MRRIPVEGEPRILDGVAGRIAAAVAGLLFLAIAVLVAAGFAGLAQYPLWGRLLLAFLLSVYGLWRFSHALRRRPSGVEN